MKKTKAMLEKELADVQARLDVYEPPVIVTLVTKISTIELKANEAIDIIVEECERETGKTLCRTFKHSTTKPRPAVELWNDSGPIKEGLLRIGRYAKKYHDFDSECIFINWTKTILREGYERG